MGSKRSLLNSILPAESLRSTGTDVFVKLPSEIGELKGAEGERLGDLEWFVPTDEPDSFGDGAELGGIVGTADEKVAFVGVETLPEGTVSPSVASTVGDDGFDTGEGVALGLEGDGDLFPPSGVSNDGDTLILKEKTGAFEGDQVAPGAKEDFVGCLVTSKVMGGDEGASVILTVK